MGMNLRDQFPGYLKKEDFPTPKLVTIASFEQISFENEVDSKIVMHLEELNKGMVVNRTNGEILCGIFGNDTDEMIGKKIVIYADPNVSFGGRLVGGLRVRAPKPDALAAKNGKSKGTKVAPQEDDESHQAEFEAAQTESDDDLPF